MRAPRFAHRASMVAVPTWRHALLGAWLLLAALGSQAAEGPTKLKMCVFDPQATRGEGFMAARDYRVEMLDHGVDLELRPFTDERVAIEEFRTGQCDAVMATALRTRQFNAMAAALDSVGASSIVRQGKVDLAASYDVVRRFIQSMSQPKAADLMTEGAYEVAGIFPLGAVYAFVNDRALASIDNLAGKRVGAFDHDKAQAEMVARIGARPVAVDIHNFGVAFNNGTVDAIAAPSIAFKPFELAKGIGKRGAVIRFPLTISTYQLVIRSAKYPPGFGQKSRAYIAHNFDLAMATLKLADRTIPEDLWVDLTPAEATRHQQTMREIRIRMAEAGFYDKQGLKLIKKIRCAMGPEAAECTDNTENW